MKLRKAESAADKVEWTMKFIRAAERQSVPKMRKGCTVCLDILEFCDPEDPETRSREGFVKLKEKVITMARGEIPWKTWRRSKKVNPVSNPGKKTTS